MEMLSMWLQSAAALRGQGAAEPPDVAVADALHLG